MTEHEMLELAAKAKGIGRGEYINAVLSGSPPTDSQECGSPSGQSA